MNKKNLSPFHGYPTTKLRYSRDGKPYYTIKVREFTPESKKQSISGGYVLSILGILALIILSNTADPPPFPALALFVLVVTGFLNEFMFKESWKMVITPDQFKVTGGFLWKAYDRNIEHQYSLLAHDNVELEKEEIELKFQQMEEKERKTKKVSDLTFYGNSFHLSYIYLGQRNDIATIYGRKEAMAIITRLKACDAAMNGNINAGTGSAIIPENQWNNEPGDID